MSRYFLIPPDLAGQLAGATLKSTRSMVRIAEAANLKDLLASAMLDAQEEWASAVVRGDELAMRAWAARQAKIRRAALHAHYRFMRRLAARTLVTLEYTAN